MNRDQLITILNESTPAVRAALTTLHAAQTRETCHTCDNGETQ